MHAFSIVTLGIFVAGYITARWDLVTRLYELAIFAWDHGVVVCCYMCPCLTPPRLRASCTYRPIPSTNKGYLLQTRTLKGFVFLSVFFFLLVLPINHLA